VQQDGPQMRAPENDLSLLHCFVRISMLEVTAGWSQEPTRSGRAIEEQTPEGAVTLEQ
jgi:hypothetical protein